MPSTVPQEASPAPRPVNPTEVGWQFVPQYYNFVNKQPHRLHCFYTKNSTFSHGTEGDDSKPAYGQHEIHSKILALGYENCKVFINSVDAQSSSQNGIIIQVVGEMSNKGEPWKKFVQTFFLAEQPNGYFVLNDIFRFLKEESVGDEEDEEEGEQEGEAVEAPPFIAEPTPGKAVTPEPPIDTAPIDQVVAAYESEAPAPQPVPHPGQVDPPIVEREPTPEPEPETHTNGIHGHDEPQPQVEPEPVTTVPETSPIPIAEPPVKVPSPAPPQSAPVPAPPAAPSGPKTWATLAASNNKKWTPGIASDAKGVSAAAPATPPPKRPINTNAPAPRTFGTQPAEQPVQSAQCFVKGVTENVAEQVMRDTLTERFGAIKELDIVRAKACAFLEFVEVESARQAIQVCLSTSMGGEGGIRLEGKPGPNNLPPRIIVETRKDRADRPISRPRGGGPGGEGRGMAIGMGAGEGMGRGRGGRGGMRGRGGPGPAAGGPPRA